MNTTLKKMFFASLCVPLTLALCMCLTYLGLEIWKIWGECPHGQIPEENFFIVLFVVMMICSLFAGKMLLSILIKVRWKGTDKLPERTEGYIHVAFFTKEKCLLNGMYYFTQKQFVSYDGVTFRRDEVISWCHDHRIEYFIRFYNYAPGNEF